MDPGSANWGIVDGLPGFVPGLDENMLGQVAENVEAFTPTLIATLAAYKPKANFATLNSNLDAVQITFYGLMLGEDPVSVAQDWYNILETTNAALSPIGNFRFLTDEGGFHTFLATNERTYEAGATGVKVADWLRLIVQPGRTGWESLDAGPPATPE